jgi:PKD repeat protein
VANATGGFTLAFAVPATVGGRHSLVIIDGNAGFVVSVARIPSTTSNYDGSWRNSNFTVTLTPDPFNSEIYYRVNSGAVLRVAADGQPRITTEGDNNTLEYWIVDEFGNEEFPHKMLSQVKLDKTAPVGSIQIGNGGIYNNSTSVTLTLTATDLISGVSQIRFGNDGVWDAEAWETPSITKNWTLTTENGEKTVYYQIMDNAGLTSLYSASIILDTVKPSASAGEDQTVTAGSLVTLIAGDCQDNVGISSYNWSFGDGTNGTGIEATHTYLSSGTYAVTLTVQDSAGNTASSSVLVTVQNALGNAIPEFPSFLIVPMLIALPLSALLMKRKSLRH